MADISRLEEQANLLSNNVSGWEQNVLTRIGKRIKKYGKLSLSDVKSINNIAVVKQDMDAITKELAKVTGYNISQIEQMYGELLEEQHLANQPLYDYRGKKFVPFAENKELQAIARAYAKTTGETMINLAKTKALCILDHNGNVNGLQKYYTDVLDKAVMQVTTGATDFHTAMRDSIIELGGSGVRVDYGGGVTRRLDTAVRQNLLWGAKQASTEYNTMIGEELGADGIEVDFHSNPRPSHEFMQGKQYVLGKARTINGIHFESADEALERLQDYGCLHYKTPIICGISEPRYSPEELKRLNEQNAKKYTVDGKEYSGYEVTQMQRRLESSVRNEKTTRDLAKASGDNALVKRCNERIKAYQGKYNEISEITGIQGDKKRMSVPRGTATVKGVTQTQKISKLTGIPEDRIKLDGISQEGQEIIANGIQKAYSAFPQLKQHTQMISADKSMTDALGKSRSITGSVSFNPNKFEDLEKLRKNYDYDMRLGFHTKGSTVEDIATHEFGHQLDGWLTKKGVYGSYISEYGVRNASEEIQKEVLSRAGLGDDVLREIRKSYAEKGLTGKDLTHAVLFERKEFISNGLSEYALTNAHEFFAECFTEYVSSPTPRKIAKIFGDVIQEILGGLQ